MAETQLLQVLEDRIEIEDLLTRYCSAIDAKDFDRLATVFTRDAVIDYTRSGGIKGEFPAVKKWLAKALAPFSMTQHVVSNIELAVQDERARCVCSFFNPMGLPKDDGSLHMFFCGGYYRDALLRTGDGWRICERVIDQIYMYGSLPGGR